VERETGPAAGKDHHRRAHRRGEPPARSSSNSTRTCCASTGGTDDQLRQPSENRDIALRVMSRSCARVGKAPKTGLMHGVRPNANALSKSNASILWAALSRPGSPRSLKQHREADTEPKQDDRQGRHPHDLGRRRGRTMTCVAIVGRARPARGLVARRLRGAISGPMQCRLLGFGRRYRSHSVLETCGDQPPIDRIGGHEAGKQRHAHDEPEIRRERA